MIALPFFDQRFMAGLGTTTPLESQPECDAFFEKNKALENYKDYSMRQILAVSDPKIAKLLNQPYCPLPLPWYERIIRVICGG